MCLLLPPSRSTWYFRLSWMLGLCFWCFLVELLCLIFSLRLVYSWPDDFLIWSLFFEFVLMDIFEETHTIIRFLMALMWFAYSRLHLWCISPAFVRLSSIFLHLGVNGCVMSVLLAPDCLEMLLIWCIINIFCCFLPLAGLTLLVRYLA